MSRVRVHFKLFTGVPWLPDFLVNPRYEDTLRNLVKTTFHYVNPAEHLLPQFAPANHLGSSKRPSKSWSSLYLQSSSSTETRPVPIEIDVANSVSIMLTIAQRIDPDANIRASVRWVRLLILLSKIANQIAVLVARVSQSKTRSTSAYSV